jgi:hypothetical protein
LPGVSDLMLSRDLPSIIHFAGHNTFSNEAGPSISLEGAPWEPSDLALAVMRTSLAQVHPLVFLNGCRSAKEIPWFFQMSGWAPEFIAAGAGSVHRFVVGCAVTRAVGGIFVYQRHREQISDRVRSVIAEVNPDLGMSARQPVDVLAHSLGGEPLDPVA